MRTIPMRPTPRGFTLFELVVILALLVALLGLFLPAVQKIREAAARTKCQNNMRQITLATINLADSNNGALPPAVGDFPDAKANGSLFFHILPYIEQDNLYKLAGDDNGDRSPFNNGVCTYVIKTYVCPSDASGGAAPLYEGWLATGNYASNYLLFGLPGARFPASITDGTSNTIGFCERRQMCNQTPNAWAYSAETDWAPMFAYSSVAKFQVQPPAIQCNPALAQSSHPGGCPVGMCDGSVRMVHEALTATTWHFALTPNGGEVLGSDW